MSLSEALTRRNMQDIIEIGQVLEKFYNGKQGTIFRAIVNGRIKEQFSHLPDKDVSSDRRLGRAEGMQMIQDDIELAIQQMHSLTEQRGGQEDDG